MSSVLIIILKSALMMSSTQLVCRAQSAKRKKSVLGKVMKVPELKLGAKHKTQKISSGKSSESSRTEVKRKVQSAILKAES